MRNCEIARGMNGGGGRQDGCMMLPTMARKLSMNIVPRGGGKWREVGREGKMDGKMARGEETGMKGASWMGCWMGGGKNNDIGREDSRE